MFDAIFFDFYGTLVTGDRHAVEQTCACVVKDLALPMSASELATAWGHGFFDAIEHANGDTFSTLFDLEVNTLKQTLGERANGVDATKYAKMLKSYWQQPQLAPHVHETLSVIDVPVCVVSNADTEDVLHAIDFHGIDIQNVVTSEDTRSYKPHSAIFEHALKKMNVRPERVLHVGDSLHSDVGGAHQLGITACWIDRTDRIMDIGKVDNVPIPHKISCIKELGDILSAPC
ncbi:MAG: HAD family hydrolase [Phycisphaerae bacterium]